MLTPALTQRSESFPAVPEVKLSRLSGSRGRSYSPLIASGIAAVLLLAIGLAGYQLFFKTENGTLIVEVDGDAHVRFQKGVLRIYDEKSELKYTLKPSEKNKTLPAGKYLIDVTGADGLKLDTDRFEIAKDGKGAKVRVTVDAGELPTRQDGKRWALEFEINSSGDIPTLKRPAEGPLTLESGFGHGSTRANRPPSAWPAKPVKPNSIPARIHGWPSTPAGPASN